MLPHPVPPKGGGFTDPLSGTLNHLRPILLRSSRDDAKPIVRQGTLGLQGFRSRRNKPGLDFVGPRFGATTALGSVVRNAKRSYHWSSRLPSPCARMSSASRCRQRCAACYLGNQCGMTGAMPWGDVVIVYVMRIAPDAGASGDEVLLDVLRRSDSGLVGRVFRVALGDGPCECRRAWKREQCADRGSLMRMNDEPSHE